jgi:hypothetical protein
VGWRRLGPGLLDLREEAEAWTPGFEGGGQGPGPLNVKEKAGGLKPWA